MIKTIISIMLTTVLVYANPYVGLVGSMSNTDRTQIECKASAGILVGMKVASFDKITVDVEARAYRGMAGDYESYNAYMKPTYKNVYGLIGIGQTKYGNESFTGGRLGAGFEINHVFLDVIYDNSTEDTAVSLGFRYRF